LVVAENAGRQADHRRHRRQPVHYPGWIVFERGHAPYQCMLSNISASGAKIRFDDNLQPPSEFTLLLSPTGGKRRHCRVKWRDGDCVGVEFLS
jgi:hypothetical protein